MEKIYMVCLAVGIIYTILSFVLGGLMDMFDFDFDLDLEGGIDSFPFLPIKPFVIMSFVTVFGGMGLILSQLPMWALLTVPVSAVTGVAVAKFLFQFVYIPLYKNQTLVKKQADSLGQPATILEAIAPGGFGRISYTVNGNILSGAAKEFEPGNGFKKGEVVLIHKIENNIYLVGKLNAMSTAIESETRLQ